MRFSGWLFVAGCLSVAASFIFAQPPIRPERDAGSAGGDASAFIARMMKLDANHDGKLQKDEVTDARMSALFERADADHDGVVTTEELTSLYKKESPSLSRGGPEGFFGGWFGGGGPGGPGGPPGGFGGPGGPGPGGPGGRGGFGPPPMIGQVLPPPFQDMLQLTDAQRTKLADLQKQVDSTLANILTDEQRQQLDEMRTRGPRGGPGGPGGFAPPRNRGGPPQ